MNWLRNNWLVGSLWIACGGLVISLGVAVWLLFENGLVRTIYRDRGSLRLEARSVRVRHVVWGPATEIPDEPPERGSAAPSDGPPQSLLFLALPTPRGDRDIFVRHRRADGWSAPRPLDGPEDGGVNTTSNELSPVLARDGERLYFASDRAGGHGGLDLWSARRVDGGWSEPRNLGRRVNSPFDDGSPAIHPGGQILVYATNRPVGFLLSPPDDWRDVSLEGRTKGPGNLGMSAAALRGDRLYWSTPVVLGGINSSADDVAPCFSPAGDFLYFASDRAGGQGGYDLYRSAVVGAPEDDGRTVRLLLEAPDNLGRPVNSFEDERRPRPIDQGFALLFERKAGASEKTSLLESRSVEVEKRLEIAQLPLAAVAADVVRLLIFALTALVVAVCTVWLLRTRRRWAVNLLVRCAAVALLIHLAMLYGFYFWKVSRHLVALAEKERQEEISLESSLAAQISVEVSRQDIDVPEPDARRLDMAPLAEWPEEALEPAPPRVDRSPADDLPHLETIQLTVASVTRPRIPDDPPPRRPLPRPERERRHEAALLPELERVPVERDLEVEPSLERETSQRVDAETARSTRLERLETTIAAPTPSPRRTDLELARTAVLGPQPSPLLPPVARTPVDVESRLARLPVPAARARDDDAPRPSRSPSVPASVWNAALGDPPKPLPPSRIDSPVAAWESPASGLHPNLELEADERVPRSALPPRPSPERLASTRQPRSETLPVAPRPPVEPGGERQLAGPLPERQRPVPSELRPSAVDVRASAAAVSPVSLAARNAPLARESALARVAPRSSMGALAPLRTARRRAVDRAPASRLPEAAAAGGQLADVVSSPNSAKSRRLLTPARLLGEPPALERPPTPGADSREPLPSPALLWPPSAPGGAPLGRRSALAGGGPRAIPPDRPRTAGTSSLPEVESSEPLRSDIRTLRRPATRERLVRRMGGTDASEEAVRRALDWFVRHQSADGRWDTDGFDQHCGSCSSLGYLADVDSAVTGMVILAFLGHNHTPGSGGPYASHVGRALDWLLARQDPRSGSLAGADRRYTMYSHGIATLAVSEAFLMTRDKRYFRALEKAKELIVRAQNPSTGGWRYLPRPPLRGDTSITGWQVLALASLSSSGIEVPQSTFDLARHWLDEEASGGRRGGIYGYRYPGEPRLAMTAEGMYALMLLGDKRGQPNIEEAARYIHTKTRDGSHLNNLYLLYYGTLALYQYQGIIWETWNGQVRDYLIANQRREGTLSGSWEPLDEYMETGGRVLATAFAVLTLEVYYRYLPLYWSPGEGSRQAR